jgi:hypothetical protein
MELYLVLLIQQLQVALVEPLLQRSCVRGPRPPQVRRETISAIRTGGRSSLDRPVAPA